MDLGAGDGRFVLGTARDDPAALVIGVDANASGLREASRRAARPVSKGGLPNALFVVAGLEALPASLDGIADDVRVHFPWGSLLRGVLGLDGDAMAGIARVAAPGAAVTVLTSLTDRDAGIGVPTVPVPDAVAGVWRDRGFELVEWRPATPGEVAAARSSWAKRLRAGSDRPVTLLQLVRA